MELFRARALLDAVDRAIVALLRRRAALVRHAFRAKSVTGQPMVDGEREAQMMSARRRWAKDNGLDPERTEAVFRAVLAATRPT